MKGMLVLPVVSTSTVVVAAILLLLSGCSFATFCFTQTNVSTSSIICFNETTGSQEVYFSHSEGSSKGCLSSNENSSILCFGFAHGTSTSMGCINFETKYYFHNLSIVPGVNIDCDVSPLATQVCYMIEQAPSNGLASIYKLCLRTMDGEFIYHDDRASGDNLYERPQSILSGAGFRTFAAEDRSCWGAAGVGTNNPWGPGGHHCLNLADKSESSTEEWSDFFNRPYDFVSSEDLYYNFRAQTFNQHGYYCTGDTYSVNWYYRFNTRRFCGSGGLAADLDLAFNPKQQKVFCYAAAAPLTQYGCSLIQGFSNQSRSLKVEPGAFSDTEIQVSLRDAIVCSAFCSNVSVRFSCSNVTSSNENDWSEFVNRSLDFGASTVHVAFSSTMPIVCFVTGGNYYFECINYETGATITSKSVQNSTTGLSAIAVNFDGNIFCFIGGDSNAVSWECFSGANLTSLGVFQSPASSYLIMASTSSQLFNSKDLKIEYANIISNSKTKIPRSFAVSKKAFVVSQDAQLSVEGNFSVSSPSSIETSNITIESSSVIIKENFILASNVNLNIKKPATVITIGGNISIPVGANVTVSAYQNRVARAPLSVSGCSNFAGNLFVLVQDPNVSSAAIADFNPNCIESQFASVKVEHVDRCLFARNARANVSGSSYSVFWEIDLICFSSSSIPRPFNVIIATIFAYFAYINL